MEKVTIIIPGNTLDLALGSEVDKLEQLNWASREIFILATIQTLVDIGVSFVPGSPNCWNYWVDLLDRYDYWDMGRDCVEDELIARTSFTYAGFIVSRFNLYSLHSLVNVDVQLERGDIYINGRQQ